MRRDQPSVAATRHDLMPSAAQSSSTVNSMVTITGTGDHDRPEWLITVAGIRTLVYSPNAKYLYIGREGRDVIWSMHNHWINSNADMYAAINDTPGRVGPLFERPPASTREYFLTWLERDFIRQPLGECPFVVGNSRSTKPPYDAFRTPKGRLPREIRRIADFLGVQIDPTKWSATLEHCSFDCMKANATKSVSLGGAFWDGGAGTFIHQGTNGRWRHELTEADCHLYEETGRRELTEECANWLASGGGKASY